MNRLTTLALGAAALVSFGVAATAFAQQQFGTADEAKAMLTKAVTAVKAALESPS